jgi:hypothetical protein
LGASLFSTNISAEHLVGLAGEDHRVGLAVGLRMDGLLLFVDRLLLAGLRFGELDPMTAGPEW